MIHPGITFRIILSAIILGFAFPRIVQAQSSRDSISKVLFNNKRDSNTVNLLYTLGETFERENPDSASYYYKKAKDIATAINYAKGVGTYAGYQIVILNNSGKFREALNLTLDALDIFKKLGRKRDLAIAYLNVGSEWEYLSDFSSAAENYLLSLKIAEELADLHLQRIINNNLASIFLQLKEYQKGLDYAQKSYNIAAGLKDLYAQTSSLYNMATAYTYLKQYSKSLGLFRKIEAIGRQNSDNIVLMDGWLGMADANNKQKNFTVARQFYDSVLSMAKKQPSPEYELFAAMGMGESLVQANDFSAAAPYLESATHLAKSFGARIELSHLYEKTSEMYEGMADWKKALEYRKQFETLNDSLLGEKSKETVANLEAKFRFEKKEAQISLQQTIINQKNTLNYILMAGVLLTVIILVLAYRNYKNRQKLQEQRISELETEKQLTATESILKGEEQERSRLAKDLHDGLGGMLSGIKFSLNNIKDRMAMVPEDAETFEQNIVQLDSSISEMRRVAHNLMPEALLKFGLDEALNDFCSELNRSTPVNVVYHSFGLKYAAIPQGLALTAYRIVQELLSNAIKHAAGRQVIVQLSIEDQQLEITVEDDGRGMDTGLLSQAKGIGWSNIRSRVDYHKGILEVRSAIGEGTTVFIKIPNE